MITTKAQVVVDEDFDGAALVRRIERLGRTCYRSASENTVETGRAFVAMLIKRGHGAMLEHADNLAVTFTTDRGVSHEAVRHRLASFAQESTRFCNYAKGRFGNDVTVLDPFFFSYCADGLAGNLACPCVECEARRTWEGAMEHACRAYLRLLELGKPPEEARTVLPQSTRTEIVVTANPREWRHIFRLRAAGVTGKPHPQMLQLMVPLLRVMHRLAPGVFDDIQPMNPGRTVDWAKVLYRGAEVPLVGV